MGTFNNPALEGLRLSKQLHFASEILCPHLNKPIIMYAEMCMHNCDDKKDDEDVSLFNQLKTTMQIDLKAQD